MSLRRPVALAAGVLLLGAPALTACGFDYPTDRVNTISNGATDRDKTVYVLNAVVVASRPNSGSVIATFSNSSNRDPARLISIDATNGEPLEVTQLTEESSIGLFAGGAATLASDPVVRVVGDFEAGQFISLSFNFDNGEQVTLDAPVVTECGQYDGLDVAPALEVQEDTFPEPAYDCGPPVAGEGVDAEVSEPEGEGEGESEEAADTEEAE